MSRITHFIKFFTLWEFVKAYGLKKARHAELVSASIVANKRMVAVYKWTLKQVQGDELLGGKI